MFLFGLSVFQYHCVCADASIFNQFWNTDPHLAVAHYRRPIGLSKAPQLGSLKEMVTYLVSRPPGGAAAAHYTSVSLFHTTVLI